MLHLGSVLKLLLVSVTSSGLLDPTLCSSMVGLKLMPVLVAPPINSCYFFSRYLFYILIITRTPRLRFGRDLVDVFPRVSRSFLNSSGTKITSQSHKKMEIQNFEQEIATISG